MQELIAASIEVARELKVRSSVYPKLVVAGKLTQGEADRRMSALRYVLCLLEEAKVAQLSPTPTIRRE